jgi:hypothetical protein
MAGWCYVDTQTFACFGTPLSFNPPFLFPIAFISSHRWVRLVLGLMLVLWALAGNKSTLPTYDNTFTFDF